MKLPYPTATFKTWIFQTEKSHIPQPNNENAEFDGWISIFAAFQRYVMRHIINVFRSTNDVLIETIHGKKKKKKIKKKKKKKRKRKKKKKNKCSFRQKRKKNK